MSGASVCDVNERLSALELRVQQQEDELVVMKAAMADALRRLDMATPRKQQEQQRGGKGGPLREAYSMSCIANGGTTRKRDSASFSRKDTLSSAAKSPRTGHNPARPRSPRRHKDSCPGPAPHRTAQATGQSPTQRKSDRRPPPQERGTPMAHNRCVAAAPSQRKFLSEQIKLCVCFFFSEGNIKMFMRGRPITMFIPSDVENYDDVRTELPPERLKLEWVYGYRGRDCRANVCLLPTGEMVYFIASVVILFNYEERTQRHYLGHTDCVKCSQEWTRMDGVSLSTLSIIGSGTFERGVGSLAFSKADSGQHLSVIDDSNDHMLTVWEWQKKNKVAEIKTTNELVLAVDFHPTDPGTIVTCGKSHIFFWTWSGSSLIRKQGIFGKYEKPKFVQCVSFLRTGDILTGDSGGILLVWTRNASDTPPGKGPRAFQIVRQVKGHEGSVFCVCEMRSGALLTGGGKDHKIILWDSELRPERDVQVPDQLGTIRAVSEGKEEELLVGTSRNFILRGTFNDGFLVQVQGHTDELWGLATHPFKDVFLTCAQDRLMCLWNATEHTLIWSRLLEEHGHCADFHPSGAVVAIGTHSGKWYVLDAESTDLVGIHTDGNEQLSVMRYSVDGSLLAVGSHDNFIYLYNVSERGRKYSRYGKCSGHSSYITHLDWSPDNNFIMSNSGDYEILYCDYKQGGRGLAAAISFTFSVFNMNNISSELQKICGNKLCFYGRD
uniref:HELP domain-containing protein n=1 Tax=Gouania willdenowi TaxID=441366 RepID=A0A8C5GEG4_GOUWI